MQIDFYFFNFYQRKKKIARKHTLIKILIKVPELVTFHPVQHIRVVNILQNDIEFVRLLYSIISWVSFQKCQTLGSSILWSPLCLVMRKMLHWPMLLQIAMFSLGPDRSLKPFLPILQQIQRRWSGALVPKFSR